MYQVSSLLQASPIQGTVALAAACLVSFIGSTVAYKYKNTNKAVIFIYRLLVTCAVLCFIATILYYFLGTIYVRDCKLSASGTCSTTCGAGESSSYRVDEIALFGGTCDLKRKVPCYNRTTCGINASELGPWDMTPWTSFTTNYQGSRDAKWIYTTPSASTTADSLQWSFRNASLSDSKIDIKVNLDLVLDGTCLAVLWNGSSIKPATLTNPFRWSNLNFTGKTNNSTNGYNTLEIQTVNEDGGGAGLLYSVTDSVTSTPYMISSSGTTFVKL